MSSPGSNTVVEFTEHELRLARQGAMSAARSARGLISSDDLIGEAYLWMAAQPDKVVGWREKGRHGENILRKACRQACLTVVARQRRIVSRLEGGDIFYYSMMAVRDTLPDIFDPEHWTDKSTDLFEIQRSTKRPNEGMGHITTIADVRKGFQSLSPDEQMLLRLLYEDMYTWQKTSELLEVTERTVRRREERAVERIVEKLGGESPRWGG